MTSLGGADSPEYGTGIVVEDMRTTIQGLADHMVYSKYHLELR